jgi:transcriptional regulator with XRE-family HTH domain
MPSPSDHECRGQCNTLHRMDESTTALSLTIGARVKQERNARRWTLDHLAEVAGVSRRMVVNVEQGTANPSVGTLLRLSDALGIGLPALVEPPTPSTARVTRRGKGSTLWRGEFGGQGVLVAGTSSPDVLELWDWTLAGGDQHVSEEHSAGTRELLQVQRGTVRVNVAAESFTLEAGDAITFRGDLPHTYSNPGQDTARFSLAVFEPGVGSK